MPDPSVASAPAGVRWESEPDADAEHPDGLTYVARVGSIRLRVSRSLDGRTWGFSGFTADSHELFHVEDAAADSAACKDAALAAVGKWLGEGLADLGVVPSEIEVERATALLRAVAPWVKNLPDRIREQTDAFLRAHPDPEGPEFLTCEGCAKVIQHPGEGYVCLRHGRSAREARARRQEQEAPVGP